MNNEYIYHVRTRPAKPRSKAARSANQGATPGGSTIVVGGGTGNSTHAGHSHSNLPTLEKISEIDSYGYQHVIHLAEDGNTIVKEKVKSGFADMAHDSNLWMGKRFSDYLDQALRSTDVVSFLKVLASTLATPDFVDSMISGRGTAILPNGRLQTDRLEVRGSMTVMDLLINEIHAMAGEFNFSDVGKIERVELAGENTYRLYMAREFPTDVTSLDANDVLVSIVNNLRIGGTDYYSSWFRVLDKDIADNSLTVVLYPDVEVPGGKNYPPIAGYNVTRRGNSTIPDGDTINNRAQSWLLSNREGRIMFLANVYKPILQDFNYSLVLGKLPNLDVIDRLGLTGDVGLYAQTVVCEKLYEVDWNGDVMPRKVDRGPWTQVVANSDKPYRYVTRIKEYPDGKKYTELEQHTVWHYGCKWGCLIDRATAEPVWNSPDWAMLEGDPSYYLNFDSSNGWQFRIGKVDTVITALVSYANRDITEIILNTPGTHIAWSRDTGNPAEDTVWKPATGDTPNIIYLTDEDMGTGWGQFYRSVSFSCRVFIPIGENSEVVNSINIKI